MAFSLAQRVKNLPTMQETQEMRVQSLGQEDPLEEGLATHSSILAWEIPMERGAWWVSVHRIAQSWTQLKQFSMHAYTTGSEITHRILARTQIPLVITYTHTCNPLVQNHLEQCRPLLKFSLERESVTSHN